MFFRQVADNNDDADVAGKDEDHKPASVKSKETRRIKGNPNGDNSNIEMGGLNGTGVGIEGVGNDADHEDDGEPATWVNI